MARELPALGGMLRLWFCTARGSGPPPALPSSPGLPFRISEASSHLWATTRAWGITGGGRSCEKRGGRATGSRCERGHPEAGTRGSGAGGGGAWSWEVLSPPSPPLSGSPWVSPVSSGPEPWAEPEPGPLLGPLDTSLFLLPFPEPGAIASGAAVLRPGLRNWVVRAQEGLNYVRCGAITALFLCPAAAQALETWRGVGGGGGDKREATGRPLNSQGAHRAL